MVWSAQYGYRRIVNPPEPREFFGGDNRYKLQIIRLYSVFIRIRHPIIPNLIASY